MAIAVGAAMAPIAGAQDRARWPLPTVELPTELSRVLRDYEAAWKAGDGTRLAEVFTQDGFIMPNGRLPARGTAAIRASHTKPGGDLQLVAFAYATADTVGYIIGGYRYPDTVGPGGKFVLALRRDAQRRWRIAADIENGSQQR
jgi:ketosteroid isomerase-like protein